MNKVDEFVAYCKILFQNSPGLTEGKQFELCQYSRSPVQVQLSKIAKNFFKNMCYFILLL
jgi:hypothetical protein